MSNTTPVQHIHITLSLVCLLKKVQGHIEESSLGAVLYDDVSNHLGTQRTCNSSGNNKNRARSLRGKMTCG